MPEAILSGRLLTEDGKPIAGAVVRPIYGSQSAFTDKTGVFELKGLRECQKDCKLRVEIQELTRRLLLVKEDSKTLGPPDWVDTTISPWIAGQQIRNLELRVASVPLMSFSGVVTNAPKNSLVQLLREGSTANTLEEPLKDAKLAFELLPVGNYRLLFRKAMDYRSAPGEVEIRIVFRSPRSKDHVTQAAEHCRCGPAQWQTVLPARLPGLFVPTIQRRLPRRSRCCA